ncbi:hypothetical protein OBDJBBDK_00118 [Aeromonas phage AhFM11]|nr:hypothetical protein OBDJBBDK_00118 [Aeromonas phage AhFM11]
MSIKNVVEFVRTKIATFVKKNTSVEDQYTKAAEHVISQIKKLEVAHVKSMNEEKRLRTLAGHKEIDASRKDDEIRTLISRGVPVDTQVKLAILYRRTASALNTRADDLVKMRDEIKVAVVELDNTRVDLAAKLEFIRETRNAEELGISCADDVIEMAGLTRVDVNDVMMRIETFHGDKQTAVTVSEVENYIAGLK